jgi:hypothetical protein
VTATNPLMLLPTWTEKAEHMERVAEECRKRGMERRAEHYDLNAKTFRLLAEEEGE